MLLDDRPHGREALLGKSPRKERRHFGFVDCRLLSADILPPDGADQPATER